MIHFGRGIMLDAVCKEDAELMRSWRNDPQVWKWCRQNDLISDADQQKWFESQSEDPSIKMYLIRTLGQMGEQAVGVCGLTSIDLYNHRAEFSLYIAPEWMRRGFGKKALGTLLDHAFINLGLHLVWGESFENNPAIDLFLQLGFNADGIRREHYFKQGRYVDAHLFSITAKEWGLCSTPASSSE